MISRGSLAWKLYLLGVVQLALIVAAATIVFIRDLPPPPPHDPDQQIALAVSRLKALLGHPADLANELDELRTHGMAGSVYAADGTLLASNVEPPLSREPSDHDRGGEDRIGPTPRPGPAPDENGLSSSPPPGPFPPDEPPQNALLPPHHWEGHRGSSLHHGGPPSRVRIVPMGDAALGPQPVLVAHFVPPPRDLRGLFFTLGLGVILVGVGAFLTARWIVRPLEQLSRAARALGEGDLRARAGLARGDEVGEVSRTFDEMADRVERLIRAEKELLANVSHELRTPLARIRVALDLAEEGDAQAAREALSEINVDLGELEGLLEDVFTTARMQTEENKATPSALALHLVDVDPAQIVHRSLERFRARHPERPIEVAIESGLPLLRVDPVLVRRVIDNLLENAHKYSPDATRSIDLDAHAEGDRVDLEVRDRGLGIPPEDLPYVFVPFFRGERSRSRGTGGVGLGLTLAKRIVEAHGGSIDVTSVLGVGTAVRVELPTASA
jgi:two-component system, OmpR family, sensor kinase